MKARIARAAEKGRKSGLAIEARSRHPGPLDRQIEPRAICLDTTWTGRAGEALAADAKSDEPNRLAGSRRPEDYLDNRAGFFGRDIDGCRVVVGVDIEQNLVRKSRRGHKDQR